MSWSWLSFGWGFLAGALLLDSLWRIAARAAQKLINAQKQEIDILRIYQTLD